MFLCLLYFSELTSELKVKPPGRNQIGILCLNHTPPLVCVLVVLVTADVYISEAAFAPLHLRKISLCQNPSVPPSVLPIIPFTGAQSPGSRHHHLSPLTPHPHLPLSLSSHACWRRLRHMIHRRRKACRVLMCVC